MKKKKTGGGTLCQSKFMATLEIELKEAVNPNFLNLTVNKNFGSRNVSVAFLTCFC